MNVWAWTNEQDQIFLDYSTNTWHKVLHDMEEYFTMCPRKFLMDGKMDEKLKQVRKTNEKKEDDQSMLITKNYVLI